MYRQLYQMGGIGTLPMDYGQSLQVPQQQQPSFSSAQNITMNPLLNYGQPQLGQAGGTPLSMRSGGISRLGYQEGGMGMDQMMEPQMQDPMMQEQMMQSQMQQAPEGIMSMMPQGTSGGQQGMPQEGGQEQTALLTIIQLLIEQGVPPEQAQELAMQILQVFNQGGAPAVEEFANQLEQEEGMPENRTMMAGGGITGIYPRQGYFFKGVVKAVSGAVKGVAKAVKSVAKSPIGQIALAIAAPYALGPAFGAIGLGGNIAGSAFLGSAVRAGLSNLVIQGLTTGKFNPKQALLAGIGGGIAGEFLPQGVDAAAARDALNAGDYMQYGSSVQNVTPTLTSGVVPGIETGAQFASATPYDAIPGKVPVTGTNLSTYDFSPAAKSVMEPTIGDKFTQVGDYLRTTGTNLMADPIGTIGRGIGSIYDTAKTNALPLATGFLAGSSLAQQPNESDDEYASRAARDANVAAYITQYGGGSKLYSPTFYSMEKAIDPFAGRSAYVANGGRIGYANGTSLEKQYLEKKGYGDMIRNMSESEILKLYDSVVGTFSRRFQAEGTMPMGEPRKNPAGIMELDYRAKGGFVPPVGIKEKADDIPAMLSNNEFVFTADAVRNAGGGNVDRGAQRMYSLMKNLESGGRV
jgi:hypothetical protein